MWKTTAIYVGLCSLICSGNALRAADSAQAPARWLSAFRDYSAQHPPSAERNDSFTLETASSQRLRPLFLALPEPTQWLDLRQALTQAISETPTDSPTRERQKLQAARWLIDYLRGDRASVKSEIDAVVSATKDAPQNSPAEWQLSRLQEALGEKNDDRSEQSEVMQAFENYLSSRAPLDVEAVKKILGSEDNLNHLKKLAATSTTFNSRTAEVFDDYKRTKNAVGAKTELEALETEFETNTRTEREALGELLENPLVQRFAQVLMGQPEEASPTESFETLVVPDLVTLVGMEKAEDMIRHALRFSAKLRFTETTEAVTRRLTYKLLIEEMPHLKAPSWGVIDPENPAELFRLFREKFPGREAYRDYEYEEAAQAYLAWLIREGNTQEAIPFANEFVRGEPPHNLYRPLTTLEEKHPQRLWTFLVEWLTSSPDVDEWRRLSQLAAQLDRQEELKAIMARLSQSGTLKGLGQFRLLQLQAEIDLALDNVTAATEKYRDLLTGTERTKDDLQERRIVAERLLEIYRLRADATDFDAVVGLLESRFVAEWKTEPKIEVIAQAVDFAERLNHLQAYPAAARIGASASTWIEDFDRRDAATNKDQASRYRETQYVARQLVTERFRSAVQLERWNEAATLIETSASWDSDDLSGLLHRSSRDGMASIGVAFAQAALQQGDRPRARRILEASLVRDAGDDAVYLAYLNLIGAEALPLLEKLASADRYQERPLIWKARLQLDAGAPDAAIATLERAIEIDPSDGETKGGNRMRVYAFMADAMKEKHDSAKATFFTGVVKAIRHAELADRWFDIGNYTRAVALYREALDLFQDAYCIQSRLAVRLARENRMDEAIAHYRRAFELMPDSFGRVESHCFGCEHIFAGERQQTIAEEVFERLLQSNEAKPQLHYLRGYLRDEQKRYAEAATHYREAVALDPLYLNAWRRLAALADELSFTSKERDDLILKQLELDPGSRNGRPALNSVADLPRLLQAITVAKRTMVELPSTEALWPLPASAAHRAKSKSDYSQSMPFDMPQDFASIVGEHAFVQALDSYITALQRAD